MDWNRKWIAVALTLFSINALAAASVEAPKKPPVEVKIISVPPAQPSEIKVIAVPPADARGSEKQPLIVTKPAAESRVDEIVRTSHENLDRINTVISLILLIVTGALAFYTASMARETKRMAAATKQMAEIETLPYLSFHVLNFAQQMKEATAFSPERLNGLVASVQLKNPGKSRVLYIVQDIGIVFQGITYQVTPVRTMNVVHPDEIAVFFFPTIYPGVKLDIGMTGELSMLIEFWSVAAEHDSVKLKVRFETYRVQGEEGIAISWIYVEGPIYGRWKGLPSPVDAKTA